MKKRVFLLVLVILLLFVTFDVALAKFCPQCGAKNEDSSKFCMSCGNRLAVANSAAVKTNPTPPKSPPTKPTVSTDTTQPVAAVKDKYAGTPPMDRKSKNPLEHFKWGMQFLNKEDYSNAKDEFSRAVELKPDYMEALGKLGQTYYKLQYIDEAEEVFRRVQQFDRENVDANFYLAVLAHLRGDTATEERFLKEVVRVDPHHRLALNNLGSLMIRENREKTALRFLKTSTLDTPTYWMAHINLAVCHILTKKYPQARQELLKAHSINPDHHLIYYNMGVLYEKEFHYNDALIQYQNALNIKPDFLEGQVNLSIALRRDSKFKQALALLKQASEKNPSSPEAWLNLSVIYTDLGMKAEAGEARNLANSYRSNYHLSEFDQGITFGTKEMYDDGSVKPVKNANPKYKYTLEVKTDHDAVALENINTKVSRRQSGGIDTFDERFAAGERYFAQGKYNNAISEYRQAIKLRGAKTFPEAYEKIGICFSNLGEFKDCIEFLKIAAKQDPKSSSILVNLSKAYGVQKNYEKQIEILTQLLEVDKDFNDTYYLLGMAYIRLKQSSNAVKALKTYLKKSPNTLKKSFVERLIKQHSK